MRRASNSVSAMNEKPQSFIVGFLPANAALQILVIIKKSLWFVFCKKCPGKPGGKEGRLRACGPWLALNRLAFGPVDRGHINPAAPVVVFGVAVAAVVIRNRRASRLIVP